jgi:hypothetical protein
MQRSKFDLLVFMIPEFFKGMIKVPDIQREHTAWTLSQKQNLLDSLYNDFDIPKIYLRKKPDEPGIWYLIDGQQRLTSIKEFMDGRFALSAAPTLPNELHHKHFDELSPQEKDKITKRILDCVIVECHDEEEEDMFIRLNNGTPLSIAEKRNAVKGDFRHLVKRLAAHPFFAEEKYNFNGKRFATDVLCAQLLSYSIDRKSVADSRTLTELYEKYKRFPDGGQHERAVSVFLDLLQRAFDKKESFLKKANIITYFVFVLHYLEIQQQLPDSEQFAKFIHDFEAALRHNRKATLKGKKTDPELSQYELASDKQPLGQASLRKRVEILMKRFNAMLSM